MKQDDAREKYERADSMYRDGDYLGSLVLLEELDKHFPDKKSVMLSRARCFYKLRRYDEALTICDDILANYDYPLADSLKEKVLRKHGDASSTGLPRASHFERADTQIYPPADTPSTSLF